VHVRYEGTDSALVVPFGGDGAMPAGSRRPTASASHFLMQGKRLVVEAVSVEAVGAGDAPDEPRFDAFAAALKCRGAVRMYSPRRNGTTPPLVVRETCARAT
jgi:5-oxoprolinase (ATP-hydrolysing)